MANILAAQAGNYSNPATWVGGVVPTTGDIACCGTFRITLDMSPLAAISDANLDWVAGGGTELGINYTGGFNIPNGATIVIPVYRYSFTRNASLSAPTCSLCITNGNVTITEAVIVDTPIVFSRPAALVNPTTTLVLTVGTVKLSNVHNTSSSYVLFDINFSSSANVTMTFGDVIPVEGSTVGMSLLSTSMTAPANLDITFTGKIFTRATSYTAVINTSSVPVGTSRIRVLSPEIALGTGTGGILSANSFKTVEFADLSLLKDSLSTSSVLINCINIVTSVVVNSDITSCGRHTLVFSGTGTFTVNGDIRKITKVGVSPNNTCLALQNMTGDITINGDVINDGTLFPSGAATHPVVQVGNANVILNSLIMVGSTTLGILIQLSAPGKTMTFSGDVDCSAVIVASNNIANIYAGVLCSATNGHHILVKGDVKGHDSPSSTSVISSLSSAKSGAIMTNTPFQSLTVEGAVYAGRSCAAITIDSATDFPITVKKVVSGANLLSTISAPPAIFTIIQKVIVDEMDFGVEGRFPIIGYIRFRTGATGIVTAKNVDNSPCVLAEQGDGLAALATNVRAGVAIGSTVGTLTVPSANTVLDGIVYDNGTVGTLNVEETVVVDFSAVTNSLKNINDILSGADHMGYTLDPQWNNVKIHVDVDEGNSVISSNGKIGADFLGVVVDATKKFRERNSLLFNASSSIKVMSNDVPLFTSGTSSFTLEMYVNPTKYPAANTLQMLFTLPNNLNLEYRPDQTLGLWVAVNTAGAVYVKSTAMLPLNKWSHIALTRNGDNFKVYLDGIQIISLNRPSTSYPTTGLDVWIGAASFNANYGFVGNIRDITFTDNVERYTTTFTVPSVCYPYTQYSTVVGDRTLAGRINAVKAKTDQLTFTNGNVNASAAIDVTSTLNAIADVKTNVVAIEATTNNFATDIASIKGKTDQLVFGSTGVVTEGSLGSGTDYTSRFDDLDLAVAAIPTLTYTARLNSIDTDLGNLIANNMRNNLVAGVVGSTGFIGLWNDTSTELSGGTPAYQRQAVVWSAPFNGIVTNTTDITINVPAGGTVAYIAGYTLVTGGTAQFSYACTEVDAVSQSVYTIPAGTLQMITTVQ